MTVPISAILKHVRVSKRVVVVVVVVVVVFVVVVVVVVVFVFFIFLFGCILIPSEGPLQRQIFIAVERISFFYKEQSHSHWYSTLALFQRTCF